MLRVLAFVAPLVAFSAAIAADAAGTTTSGACSPIVVDHGGTTTISFGNCTTQIIANYTYTLDSATTAALSRHYGITESAVLNFFVQINGESLRPYQIPQRLDALVREIRRLREELAQVSVWEETKPLWQKAIQALDDGKIDLALNLYQQIVDQSQPAIKSAIEALLTVAKADRSMGELLVLKYQYQQAIEKFKAGFDLLPPSQKLERARLATLWADAEELNETAPTITIKRAELAVSLTTDISDQLPEWHLRALLVQIRALIAGRQADSALQIFDKKVSPLLENSSLRESVWSLFCFACAGTALIDKGDYQEAVAILERGVQYSVRQVSPDNYVLGMTYLNLSSAYPEVGKKDEAIKALKLSRHYFGAARPDEMDPAIAYLYMNEAEVATDSVEKEKDYLRAFQIVSSTLPYDNYIYSEIIEKIVVAGPDVINFGAGPIKLGNFQPSEKYYDEIINIHMKNMTALVSDVEEYAASLNHLGNLLIKKRQYEGAITFFQSALDVYAGRPAGSQLAIASFNYAQVLARGLHQDPEGAERHYEQALKLYAQFEGNMSEHAVDARAVLVSFYVWRGKIDAARKLIDDYEQSIDKKPLPPEVQKAIAELRAILESK